MIRAQRSSESGREDVYSYNFPGDKKLLKLMGMYSLCLFVPSVLTITRSSAVYSIFLVETVQTALTGADLYYWFVSGFGNIVHLSTTYASGFDVPIIGSVVALTVQLFFVYRIWVLSGRTAWFICLCICLVSQSYQPRRHTLLSYLSVLCYRHRGCILGGYICTSLLSRPFFQKNLDSDPY